MSILAFFRLNTFGTIWIKPSERNPEKIRSDWSGFVPDNYHIFMC